MAGGRPRKYDSPEQMQKALEGYFKEKEDTKSPPTVCGLALHIGFISRQSFLDYSGYSQEFSDTIKRAKTAIEAYHEGKLSDNKQAAGHIFWLKNYGWADRQEVVHSFDFRTLVKDGSDSSTNKE